MRLCNRYPGANPRRASDVEKVAPDRFLIHPWSEDGDGNYKFCLNVEAVNESDAPERVTLLIDWNDIEYMDCRDYVLLGRGEEWQPVTGEVQGMVAMFELTVPPGDWFLGLHPVYDLEAFADDRRAAVEAGLAERVFGKSHGGRELVAFSAGEEGAPAVLVVSRFHPYETAGSFCVSAILKTLADDLAGGGPLTAGHRFVIVPVTNPDGVAAGCCKRARRGGPDLCHEGADSDDPAGRALAGLLAETKPAGYLDLHGWMYREHDGLTFSHQAQRDAFAAALAGDPLFNKEWKGSFSGERELVPGDFASRAYHDHGAVSFIISPSWFGRSVPQMREFGRKVLTAFCGVIR